MQEHSETELIQWEQARPVIDEVLHDLNDREREVVLLRFFEGRPFAEIGATLCLTEDAARMRVERALEKLRLLLSRRGVTSSSAALATALANQAGYAAPSGLAASIAGTALAGVATGTGAVGALAFITMKKLQLGLGATILAGILGSVWLQQARTQLRDELISLRGQGTAAVRLQTENARIVERSGALEQAASEELARLRGETATLRKQIAEAPSIPLGPGMTPTSAWRNAGRETPEAALETLLWSAENASIQAVGAMVEFPPLIRLEAEAVMRTMPAALREAGDVIGVEEMAGMAWIFGSQLAGAQLLSVQARPDDVDDATLLVRLQKRDGEVGIRELRFRHSADGWRWAISHQNLDFLGAGMGRYQKLAPYLK